MPDQTEIQYSRDGKFYYVNHALHRPTEWLSVDERPMPVPEDFKKATFSGAVEIRKRDGRSYWREVLPFSFFEVKSGRTETISEDSDLFKDYASASRWPEPKTAAFAERYAQEIKNTESLLAGAKHSVVYYEQRLAELQEASRV
jgi:hypothetical protein